MTSNDRKPQKPRPAAGLVLAAGAGTRYGKPKVLAAQGRWLTTAVAALRGGGCDDVVVVLGAAVVDVPEPSRGVVADDWADGLAASLRAGIAAIAPGHAEYAVVLLVDTPDVGARVVARVLAAARSSAHGIARAVYAGDPGHPVVVAREHWVEFAAEAHADEGGRPFLRKHAEQVIAVECSDLASGTDLDVSPGQ